MSVPTAMIRPSRRRRGSRPAVVRLGPGHRPALAGHRVHRAASEDQVCCSSSCLRYDPKPMDRTVADRRAAPRPGGSACAGGQCWEYGSLAETAAWLPRYPPGSGRWPGCRSLSLPAPVLHVQPGKFRAGLNARRSVRPDDSGRTLPADWLAVPVLSQLATVMHQETTRTGELVSLPRDDPERQPSLDRSAPGSSSDSATSSGSMSIVLDDLSMRRACNSCRLSSVSSSSVFRGLS